MSSKAYKKLALEYHPDKNSGDKDKEEAFKLTGKAFDEIKAKRGFIEVRARDRQRAARRGTPLVKFATFSGSMPIHRST
jgi:curved DNA-binding protein CbpA